MAKNDEKATETTKTLYKVTYTYLTDEGFIRTGAIVIETENPETAKQEATNRLAGTKHRNSKIGKVTRY